VCRIVAVEPAAQGRQNASSAAQVAKCCVQGVGPGGAGDTDDMVEQADLLALRADETSTLLLVALRGDF
jgi:hypothetical protein